MIDKSKWFAFSVDLEPNKDNSLEGIRAAMEWFNQIIPRGTVYATHRIATELPDVVLMLSEDHEIGVHVHPREFGHEHDQLAELPAKRQRKLIVQTRGELANAADLSPNDIVSFRAGRHSASEETFSVLAGLGFKVDSSINVRYTDYLPAELTKRRKPFWIEDGLLEVPTTYYRPPPISRVQIRVFPQRMLTATANTLRKDSPICSGERAIQNLISSVDAGISMYMHPYDATGYHSNLKNNGNSFRRRVENFLSTGEHNFWFCSASDLLQEMELEEKQ